jgi:hypothetical protein
MSDGSGLSAMSEPPGGGFGFAVEGLIEQANRLSTLAADHALSIADHVDAGYTADQLARDAARSAALVALGWAATAGELLAAATVIAKPPVDRRIPSAWFRVPAGATPCNLRLAAPLRSIYGSGRGQRFRPLRAPRVRIVPDALPGADRHFRLEVWRRGLPGITFLGDVEARTDPSSPEPDHVIPVDIQIP